MLGRNLGAIWTVSARVCGVPSCRRCCCFASFCTRGCRRRDTVARFCSTECADREGGQCRVCEKTERAVQIAETGTRAVQSVQTGKGTEKIELRRGAPPRRA
eukprot:1278565-Rhodomonas_salina.1